MILEYGWRDLWMEALIENALEIDRQGKAEEVYFYMDWWDELLNSAIADHSPSQCNWLKNSKEHIPWPS